jgi:hypothetical protein
MGLGEVTAKNFTADWAFLFRNPAFGTPRGIVFFLLVIK